MTGVRRALIFSAGERYIGLFINFFMMSAVSRLLAPAEIGLAVIGTGIMTLALSLREFATSEFLIQNGEVTRRDTQTALTFLLLLYGFVAACLLASAPLLARFYNSPELPRYLHIIVAAGLLETVSIPIAALLRRDMKFDVIATINTAALVAGAAVTITLAALGFGFMSFAWAWLASSVVTSAATFYFRPYWWIFSPAFSAWRSILSFGGYHGATVVLGRFYETLPQLVLGRTLTPNAVAFYNRSSLVVGLPDRLILSGVFSVAFPAFAAEIRQGKDIKGAYLNALSFITVLHWPALALLALLAHPIVDLLLGDQWVAVVPLVQIMSVACLFWFPVLLTQPILAANGSMHQNFVAKVVTVTVCGAVLCGSSFVGVTAMALSQFFTIPFQMIVALVMVRRHVPFRWIEIAEAVWKSAVVTASALCGAFAVIALLGFRMDLSVLEAIPAVMLSAVGWAAGLRLTRHPLYDEIASLIVRRGLELPSTSSL